MTGLVADLFICHFSVCDGTWKWNTVFGSCDFDQRLNETLACCVAIYGAL